MAMYDEEDFSKGFDLTLWKKLLKYAKPYKSWMILLAAILIGSGIVDAAFTMMSKYAIDKFIVPGNLEGMDKFMLYYGLLVILQAVNIGMLIAIAGKIEMGITYDIRKEGFKRLQELSFSYYDKTPVGWIMARMNSDTTRLGETIAWGLVDLAWGSAMMVAVMVSMLYMNWKLALITLSVVPVLAVLSIFFQQKILNLYRKVKKINSRITGAFNEGIMGAKTSKVLVREEKNLEEFKEITGQMFKASVKAAVLTSIYLPVVMALGSIGTAFVLWFGGDGLVAGTLTYGTLVAFVAYTVQFFEPIRELARIFAEFQSAQASGERVLSMIETQPDIVDKKEVIRTYGDVFFPKKENWEDIKGNIAFKNVSFSYKRGEKVLDNFNLEVKEGETIALVGETGSGKSTIVNLLCRFYEPTEGVILIDGVDYKERSLVWLQSNLGYVLQSPHLFSGTVKDNIRYGKLTATDEEIIRASKLVNAHNFIVRLSKGYDTEVGEGGNRLSTGEKQLISFARALIANPKIFVLDEATSSIDTETEKVIQHAVERVLKGRTSFIIAHRLSTIRSAGRILVIKKGKVIEQGNHKELMALKGYYYSLYTNQFKEEMGKGILDKIQVI
ncbi:putative ABC transporter ATP-binding protein [Oxobacter pfennigii]|uniref:Putative ABC transporter ATP-binding protein n=1 Tax=Oxobacter pfennigii TaxID=36849 RepID=A0A0P8YD20_9CLOT|nr:ABC transporter ATP-binding protein [Oxobacter pfennigii]KPU45117.1 putative ABC transporter ATP-binding protein [Oxobacter pfennigii]